MNIKVCLLVLFLSQVFGLPKERGESVSAEPYQEKYLTQYIDHFNYLGSAGANGQYQQRYLVSGEKNFERSLILLF